MYPESVYISRKFKVNQMAHKTSTKARIKTIKPQRFGSSVIKSLAMRCLIYGLPIHSSTNPSELTL